jgi:hypothetical protein
VQERDREMDKERLRDLTAAENALKKQTKGENRPSSATVRRDGTVATVRVNKEGTLDYSFAKAVENERKEGGGRRR